MPAVANKKIGVFETASFGTILSAWSNSFWRWSGPIRSGFSPKVDTPIHHQRFTAGFLFLSFTRVYLLRPFLFRLQLRQGM